jgi:hypothetical protein
MNRFQNFRFPTRMESVGIFLGKHCLKQVVSGTETLESV